MNAFAFFFQPRKKCLCGHPAASPEDTQGTVGELKSFQPLRASSQHPLSPLHAASASPPQQEHLLLVNMLVLSECKTDARENGAAKTAAESLTLRTDSAPLLREVARHS